MFIIWHGKGSDYVCQLVWDWIRGKVWDTCVEVVVGNTKCSDSLLSSTTRMNALYIQFAKLFLKLDDMLSLLKRLSTSLDKSKNIGILHVYSSISCSLENDEVHLMLEPASLFIKNTTQATLCMWHRSIMLPSKSWKGCKWCVLSWKTNLIPLSSCCLL